MLEYIERKAAMKKLMNDVPEQVGYSREDAVDCIRFMDASDVVPVRHGRWINYSDGVCCSVCESERPTKANDHKLSVKEVNFCYYCGAKMDLED